MENLLTQYLYNYKICPLPTVGSLIIQPGNAVAALSEKKMFAAVPAVQFVSREINADDLLQFIAVKRNVEVAEASDQLSSYCDRLNQMQPYEEITLGNAGSFYITAEGELSFKNAPLPSSYLPVVPAERVIHPEASHDMLVGDTQTNSTRMAELLDNPENSRRPRWVWAAIGLGIAGLLVLAIYIMNRQPGSMFGNGSAVKAPKAPVTYQPSGK